MRKQLATALAWYVRSAPKESPLRWRVAPFAISMLRMHGSGMGSQTVLTRHGFRMELDLSDWLGQTVFALGEYEAPTTSIFQQVLKPGSVFIDVGAHVGYFSALAARIVGENGRVYAFEAIPENAKMIRKNAQINRFENVRVESVILSDQPGSLIFHYGPEGHSGVSSIREVSGSSRHVEMKAERLDQFMSQITQVDLIKIDVEGAELRVLLGAQRILKKYRPALIIEVTPAFLEELGDSETRLMGLMDELGYTRKNIITENGLVPYGTIDFAQCNVLFQTESER